ncbi:hypothetical protein HN51_069080 [Arachis hypogaea]
MRYRLNRIISYIQFYSCADFKQSQNALQITIPEPLRPHSARIFLHEPLLSVASTASPTPWLIQPRSQPPSCTNSLFGSNSPKTQPLPMATTTKTSLSLHLLLGSTATSFIPLPNLSSPQLPSQTTLERSKQSPPF